MSEIDEAIAIVKFGQPLCCSERDAVIEVLERLQAENEELNEALDVYLNETIPTLMKKLAELPEVNDE